MEEEAAAIHDEPGVILAPRDAGSAFPFDAEAEELPPSGQLRGQQQAAGKDERADEEPPGRAAKTSCRVVPHLGPRRITTCSFSGRRHPDALLMPLLYRVAGPLQSIAHDRHVTAPTCTRSRTSSRAL
jgi:hypothetical protein